jgi:hypothetical protein
MFPSGGVVGFGCQVASSRLAPKFVPSLTWLTDDGPTFADVARTILVAKKAMSRRNRSMSEAEEACFRSVPARAHAVEVAPRGPGK